MIKIFAKEIADGIAEKIISNTSVACMSLAEVDSNPISRASQFLDRAVASANPNQPDLFYLRSVLVSTGWNNNDDVFMPNELWAARKSPEDKQFNYMHNEKDIIGHMTGSYIQDSTGKIWTNAEEYDGNITDDMVFDIVNNSVIYTSWTDEELQARSDTIVAEIKENKWFVSMECLFPSFDYQLKAESGSIQYITRNEATAYLSKHLRAYGGTGVYQGYKVGRVLRSLSFSGVGLVNKPANPKSVIITSGEDNIPNEDAPQTEIVVSVNNTINEELAHCAANTLGDKDMSKELELELEGVKAKLVEAEATIASLTNFKTQAETLEVNLKDLMAQVASVKAELVGTKASLVEALSAKEQAEAKWQGFEKKMKDEKRKAALAEVEYEDEDTSYLDALSDEAFDKVIAAMKKAKCKVTKEDDKSKKVEDKAKCNDKEAEAQEISLTVEVEKTVASLNDIATPAKTQSIREVASDWFGKNVLKTSNK